MACTLPTLVLLKPEADETTNIHTRETLAVDQHDLTEVSEFPVARGPSSARHGSLRTFSKALGLRWGLFSRTLAPATGMKAQRSRKSGMWSPETTSIPGISVTGSRRRRCADAPWTTPCTLAHSRPLLIVRPQLQARLPPSPDHPLDPGPRLKYLHTRQDGRGLIGTRGWRVHDSRP